MTKEYEELSLIFPSGKSIYLNFIDLVPYKSENFTVTERNEIARIMIDRWIAWAAQPGTTLSPPSKTEQSNSGPTTLSTPKNATD